MGYQVMRNFPVYKWNLKFSGGTKGLSVDQVLQSLEELRAARNISYDELLQQSLHLFNGKALL